MVTFAKLLGFNSAGLFAHSKNFLGLLGLHWNGFSFDGLQQGGSMRQAFERSKTDPSDVIGVVVFWLVFLIALQLAFGIWG